MKPPQVFISYAIDDKKHAEGLKHALRFNLNLRDTIYMAPIDIGWGNTPLHDIRTAIRDCDVFIMILTNNYHKASFTEQEAGMALAFGKKIVPVMVDEDQVVPHGWVKELFHAKSINKEKNGWRLRELYGSLFDVDMDSLTVTRIIDELRTSEVFDVDIFWAQKLEKLVETQDLTYSQLQELKRVMQSSKTQKADVAINTINKIFNKYKY